MKKSVFFDEDTFDMLVQLDMVKNLKPNYSAVIRLAIQELYKKEMGNYDSGTIHTRENRTDRDDQAGSED